MTPTFKRLTIALLVANLISVGLYAQDTLGAIGRLLGRTDTSQNLYVRMATGSGVMQERRAIGSLYGRVDTNGNLYVVADPTVPAAFGNLSTVAVGTGTATAVVEGTLFTSATPACTIADTNETTLITYTLPASALSANGRGVKITAFGTFGTNANTKQVKVYFGTAGVDQPGASTSALSNVPWFSNSVVLRTGAATEVAAGYQFYSGFAGAAAITTAGMSLTENTAAPIVIKITGKNSIASAGDVCASGMIVETIN